MYIVAFILLLISITKLLIICSTTWEELKEIVASTNISMIKIVILILLFDAIIGLVCSLYILI